MATNFNATAPGVYAREIDLTLFTKAIDTSIAASVGLFKWGPVNSPTYVSTLNQLESAFGKTTNSQYLDWMCAASFLSYSNTVLLTRTGGANRKNAVAASHTATGPVNVSIDNDSEFRLMHSNATTELANVEFVAAYPGEIGNSLGVVIIDAATYPSLSTLNNALKQVFPIAPSTSQYAESVGASNDEVHVAVIDVLGRFSGTVGGVLESWEHLSKASDGKKLDGSAAYFVNVINEQSKYVRAVAIDEIETATPGTYTATNFGKRTVVDGVPTAFTPFEVLYSKTLMGGNDGDAPTVSEICQSWNLYDNPQTTNSSLLYIGGACGFALTDENKLALIQQHVNDNIAIKRSDCLVSMAVPYTSVYRKNQNDAVQAISTFVKTKLNRGSSTYSTITSGWKWMIDPFLDVKRAIPCDADVVGLIARTDATNDPWWSPAGYNRGILTNVIDVVWNPTTESRGMLDTLRVNPIVSTNGEGVMLFGDRTLQVRESVFSYINVRRLFNLLKVKISEAAKYSLFEFNDLFTRNQFVAFVEPDLRTIKSRRGIVEYLVVCDETNNTADVIDAGEFRATIFIKPARSIQRVLLSFVAVRNSVQFEEVLSVAN